MYTILDENLDRQLQHPITRRAPKEECASAPKSAGKPGPKNPEPFEPWKVPFENEEEWHLFVKWMIEGLRDAPAEARKIFDSMLESLARHRAKEERG